MERLEESEAALLSDGEVIEAAPVSATAAEEDAEVPEPSAKRLKVGDDKHVLFFPSVPVEVDRAALRRIFVERHVEGAGKIKLKLKSTTGERRFNYVWVDFAGREDMESAQRALAGVEVGSGAHLAPVRHAGPGPAHAACPAMRGFREKLARVKAAGGRADTLLVRNLSAEASDAEIEAELRGRTTGLRSIRCSSAGALPTSLFSSEESEVDHGKKCWATFSDQGACEASFLRLSEQADLLSAVSDGGGVKVSLHDDTTDAHDLARKGRKLKPAGDSACIFHLRGRCTRGAECKFQHPATLPSPPSPSAPRECKFFKSGRCSRGPRCSFLHDRSASDAIDNISARIRLSQRRSSPRPPPLSPSSP